MGRLERSLPRRRAAIAGGLAVIALMAAVVGSVATASVAGAAPPPVGTVSNVVPYPDPGIDGPRGITMGPDDAIWVTSGSDTISRFTSAGGLTNEYHDPAIVNPGVISSGGDGALWFINGNGTLGRITTAGVVSVYSDPALSGVDHLTAGPDGAVWFTKAGPKVIGRITTAGVVTTFTDPLIHGPGEIVAGPDGALWFTNVLEVGRITTTGVVTSYDVSLPSDAIKPGVAGIAVGPDGALYYTARMEFMNVRAGRFGKITTAGAVTAGTYLGGLYPGKLVSTPGGPLWFLIAGGNGTTVGQLFPETLQTAFPGTSATDVSPDNGLGYWTVDTDRNAVAHDGAVVAESVDRIGDAITRGPDGALWYLTAPSTIDRVAPNGTLTRFPSPATLLRSPSMVVGSDGALWYPGTTDQGLMMNRVAMDGSVTTFPVGQPPPGWMDVTAGPDGAIWFTYTDGSYVGQIGRITTRGIVSIFSATNLFPRSIVAGRDGALWFTNSGNDGNQSGGSIGRITTDGVVSFRNPPGGGLKTEITLGPDGALWMVSQSDPLAIVRLETGPFSSYYGTAFPTTVSGTATGIDTGPDGRLWVTTSNGTILRMTTTGTYETFALPAPTQATDIGPGPDGGMWFTQVGLPPIAGSTYALGRIEALGAVNAPSAPDILAEGGDGTFTARWTVSDNGAPISGVTVTLTPGGATCSWAAGPQTCTVSGLTNGTKYTATARATNSAGTGPASGTPAAATPHKRPPQPAFVKAVNVANNCASVNWWPPQGDPIVKSRITATAGTFVWTVEFAGAGSSQTVCAPFPLTASASFKIMLLTALDSGPLSNATNSVVVGAPATPGKPTAKSGNGSAVVSWSNGPVAQTYTQSIITPYRNGVAQAPQTFTSGAASQTITGLDNGATYTFTVATRNANGTSVASDRSASIVVGLPSAPAFVSAVAGTASAKVQWWPPTVPVTSSTVTPYLNGVAQAPLVFNDAKSAQTITGLSSGQSYTFVVALTNATGTGPTSTTAAVIIG